MFAIEIGSKISFCARSVGLENYHANCYDLKCGAEDNLIFDSTPIFHSQTAAYPKIRNNEYFERMTLFVLSLELKRSSNERRESEREREIENKKQNAECSSRADFVGASWP